MTANGAVRYTGGRTGAPTRVPREGIGRHCTSPRGTPQGYSTRDTSLLLFSASQGPLYSSELFFRNSGFLDSCRLEKAVLNFILRG